MTEYEKSFLAVKGYSSHGAMWFRQKLVKQYSWAVCSEEAINAIKALNRPILEVGCGSGYWSYELRGSGVEVVATELRPLSENGQAGDKEWTEIEYISAQEAVVKYPHHVLLVVWPTYNQSWAAEALKLYQGKTVIYVGEGSYGCTGDDEFHDLLRNISNPRYVDIPCWMGIHDSMMIYG